MGKKMPPLLQQLTGGNCLSRHFMKAMQ